jgi:hypothetical protein
MICFDRHSLFHTAFIAEESEIVRMQEFVVLVHPKTLCHFFVEGQVIFYSGWNIQYGSSRIHNKWAKLGGNWQIVANHPGIL